MNLMDMGAGKAVSPRQVLSLLWVSMLVAIGCYAVVCFLVVESTDWPTVEAGDTLRHVFTGVAIVTGALSIWWSRRFLSNVVPLKAAHVQQHAMIVWALSEAVGLYGMVLCFLTHDFYEFAPFGLASAALLLYQRPSTFSVEQQEQAVG